MPRYIDADALCEEFTRFVRKANNHDYEPTPNWNDAISIFHSMPTADVAPVVHGKWIKKGQTLYMCSKCGRVIDAYSDLSKTVEKYQYCHCGARMDGER